MLQLRGKGTGAMMKHPFGDDKKISTDPNGFVDEIFTKRTKIRFIQSTTNFFSKSFNKARRTAD
jgi:hypothetical protein